MTMRNSLVIIFLNCLLVGCTSTSTNSEQISSLAYDKQELIYKNTNDYMKLIDFYKSKLAVQEDLVIRLKLIETYIDMQDYESAEFNLNLIGESKTYNSHINYLFSLVNYEKKYYGAAAIYAKKAIENNDGFSQAENLLGLIYASLGQYEQAKHYFYLARQHLEDDVKIKNNLAMIDLLEKDYENAIYRLEPLVAHGVMDEQVTANLGFAYAKTNRYTQFKALYSHKYTEQQVEQVFFYLSSAEEVTSASRKTEHLTAPVGEIDKPEGLVIQ